MPRWQLARRIERLGHGLISKPLHRQCMGSLVCIGTGFILCLLVGFPFVVDFAVERIRVIRRQALEAFAGQEQQPLQGWVPV